jgi:hypothetical protein
MNQRSSHEAGCFCGAVRFRLKGGPEAMAYCHCDSCRHWSAGPVSAFTLWKPQVLEILQGEEHISGFDGNPGSDLEEIVSIRKWCTCCGGHLFTEHPGMGLVDVPAVLIEGLEFEPGFHVHYQESVHPIRDGLTKFRDLPAEAGGSGMELAE